MQPKAILLDWDGTIVDVFHTTYRAMNETLLAMGKAPWDEKTAEINLGRPDDIQFPELFGNRADEALAIYKAANKRLKSDLSKPELMPGAEAFMQFLQEARAQGVHVGIISNKPSSLIREELSQLGWSDMIDSVTGAGDSLHNKPHPVALDKALENDPRAKKLLKSKILFIGDTNTDVEFARNTGIRFIGIGSKITHALSATEHAPDLSVVQARLELSRQTGQYIR